MGALVVRVVRAVQGDQEGVEEVGFPELVEDARERGAVHLGGDHGEDERDRESLREGQDARLQLLDRAVHEPRKGRDGALLMEIAHEGLLLQRWRNASRAGGEGAGPRPRGASPRKREPASKPRPLADGGQSGAAGADGPQDRG